MIHTRKETNELHAMIISVFYPEFPGLLCTQEDPSRARHPEILTELRTQLREEEAMHGKSPTIFMQSY